MMAKPDTDTDRVFLKSSDLRARGFTTAGIKRFLGAPDSVDEFTYGRTHVIRHLWLKTKADAIEASTEYAAWREQSSIRRAAAQQAAQKRYSATISYVEQLDITVPRLNKWVLVERACANYNDMHIGDESHASLPVGRNFKIIVEDDFLKRITVNYLRHMLTSYERELRRLHGRVGVDDAIELLREQIYDEISITYPWLSDECSAQQARREQQRLDRELYS
jgi:hypothetical protein